MSDVSALLHRMGSEQVDLKRRIVVALVENPFLDAEAEAFSARLSQPPDLVGRVLDDLCAREVLVQSGWGGLGLSPAPEVYGQALSLATELQREGASLRKQIYEMETAERLKQQLAVSQREVEAILDIVPAGVLIFDRHGHLVKSNRAAWEVLGLEKGRAGGIWEALGVQAASGDRPARPTLTELMSCAEERRWELDGPPPVEVVTRPFSVGVRGDGVILTVRDISERRAAEEAGARLREDFFSMIRHELLKPLLGVERALGGFGQGGWMEASEREALFEHARTGMQRLKAMIDDMLLLARLERDPLAVMPQERILLTLLLTSSDLSFRDRAEELGLTLRTEVPDEEVEFIGDEKRLMQVIDNLLDNALKFTPPGGTVVLRGRKVTGNRQEAERDSPYPPPLLRATPPVSPSLSPRVGEREGGRGLGEGGSWVEVSVADTGIGIPPEEQGRVFGKFYQAQQGPGRQEGLGLGLAICQRVVAAHGGRIEIDSKPGHGTTVRVLVPATSQT
jgi:signal transduction histidine kinase